MQPRFEMCQSVWVCSFFILPQPGQHAWIPASPRRVINMECILICSLEPSLARFRQNELNSGRTTDVIHEWEINLIVMCLWDFVAVCYIAIAAAAAAKPLQSCPTLCDPIDGSPPGSPVPGILQARTLEWVAISFSSVWKWKVKVKSLSRVRLLATPWTAAHQAPPSMGFSRQEYWSGLPLPSLSYTREWEIGTYLIISNY